MRPVKTAFVGLNANSHSSQVLRSTLRQKEQFDIACCVLPENERDKYPEKAVLLDGIPERSWQEVLEDPAIEAVVVETDEVHLTKYALAAAQYGKHIHMEKPGGCDAAEFRKLVEIVRRNGTVFHIGYMYRYNPAIRQLLAEVREGKLGEVLSVEAQMNCRHTDAVRQWLNGMPGGMMFFLGCHLVDLVLQLQGEPKCVLPMNRCSGVNGVVSPDSGMALLEYERGVSFVKTCAVEYGGYLRRQLVITGTRGTVELKPLEMGTEDALRTFRTEYGTDHGWHTPGLATETAPYHRYDDMLAAFAAMVWGEMENPYTPDYEWLLYRTLLRCCGVEL